MDKAFLEYYKCSDSHIDFRLLNDNQELSPASYFEFGTPVICYGASLIKGCQNTNESLPNLASEVILDGKTCKLPFDPTAVANSLRREQYVQETSKPLWKGLVRKLYYAVRPALPVSLRRHLQKAWLKGWEKAVFPRWPVDTSVDQMFESLMFLALRAVGGERIPFIWFWPGGKSSCAMMTHDVETELGLRFAGDLMDINDSFSIKSSFQLIPDARYVVTQQILDSIKQRGFEVNVHDLKHDGHLFDDREQFRKAALQINEFGERFGSRGFRSAILYRNQEWFEDLNCSYDMSVPNVGHLDPQRGGCCTVMPYFVGDLLELPVTATQDYTLFHVLQSHSTELWEQQIGMIMERHGLISFIVHPDYLDTPESLKSYRDLLTYLSMLREEQDLWIALPGQIDHWWRQRHAMQLVPSGEGWQIAGEGAERATLAYAFLKDGKLAYEFA